MQKLLILLTSSLIGNSSISNINLSIKTNIKENNKNVIVNNTELDSDKLDNWHNTLSIKQDAVAKAQYTDAMDITTTKSANTNFDNYNISVDNSKLQNMLKNKIINQDVYNIWSTKEYSEELTTEVNTIVYIPTLNNTEKKVRESDGFFYIKNNKMFFVENKNQNYVFAANLIVMFIRQWFNDQFITIIMRNSFISELNDLLLDGATEEAIDHWFLELFFSLMEQNILNAADILATYAVEGYNETIYSSKDKTHTSKYVFLDQIEQNLNNINSINDKYHSGVQENYYYFKRWIDPNSIKVISPIDSRTTFDDKINNGWFRRPGKISTNEYDYNTLISYAKYDSLWEFLNSNVQFYLGKWFFSSVGTLSKYQSSNRIFDQYESSSILKKYLNNNLEITEAQWNSVNKVESKAEILLSITDNPWNKTINFNFTSILINSNILSATENIMY